MRSTVLAVLRVLELWKNGENEADIFFNRNKHIPPKEIRITLAPRRELYYNVSEETRTDRMGAKPGRELERGAAADLWRHTLSHINSVFGRLVYLSSLRNSNTGRYEHHGLALMFGDDDAHETLYESHQRAFREWIGYGLEHQKVDLDLYLSELCVDKKPLIETWLRLAPFRNFLPANVRVAERQLYLTDLETLLDLLRSAHGVSSPDRDA